MLDVGTGMDAGGSMKGGARVAGDFGHSWSQVARLYFFDYVLGHLLAGCLLLQDLDLQRAVKTVGISSLRNGLFLRHRK